MGCDSGVDQERENGAKKKSKKSLRVLCPHFSIFFFFSSSVSLQLILCSSLWPANEPTTE